MQRIKAINDYVRNKYSCLFIKNRSGIPLYQCLHLRLVLFITLTIFVAEFIVLVPFVCSVQDRLLEKEYEYLQPFSFVLNNQCNELVDKKLRQNVLKVTETFPFNLVNLTNKDSFPISFTRKSSHLVNRTFDFSHLKKMEAISFAFLALIQGKGKMWQLVGPFDRMGRNISAITSSVTLRTILLEFAGQFMLISFSIALITALLIYFAIYMLLIHPLQKIYTNILNFVIEPDNPSHIMLPERRRDEVGMLQRHISGIETTLQKNYVRQKHLANLGLAISKINHDLLNILSSAQIISDYLSTVNNPVVQRLAPKLIQIIGRAIRYTQSTITYGRAREQAPHRQHVLLHALVEDVKETLIIEKINEIDICNYVPENFEINADSEQLYRVFTNLFRNAIYAMTNEECSVPCLVKKIVITATYTGETAIIGIKDTGPGLPKKAKEHLFSPFHGSSGNKGVGLGLAICFELIRFHGGTLKLLEEERTGGTHFEIRIPNGSISVTDK